MTRIDPEAVTRALATWPRARLAHLPTPLDALPRISAMYPGRQVYLKRDDCTGLAMGGNKARQLEFYFGDALAKGCDTILSTGATQSNYMRCIAAAAARTGLECHIQLESRVANASMDYQLSGNVYLDQLFGAHIHHYSEGEDEQGADRSIRALSASLQAEGKKPYVVPLAPVDKPRGALGYVVAAQELLNQCGQMDISPDLVVLGSGSGLTHAGLLTGLRMMGSEIPVLGGCVRREVDLQGPRVLSVCRRVEAMLGIGEVVGDTDVWVNDGALAPGYGQASETVMQAISDMARLEGVLMDPVYSAKAFATLQLLLRAGELERYQNIIVIHTGGTPALFAYREQILSSPALRL